MLLLSTNKHKKCHVLKAPVLYDKADRFTEQAACPVTVQDTVGAGDAFLAGAIRQYLKGRSALAFANAMGACVAAQTGATPTVDIREVERLVGGLE